MILFLDNDNQFAGDTWLLLLQLTALPIHYWAIEVTAPFDSEL